MTPFPPPDGDPDLHGLPEIVAPEPDVSGRIVVMELERDLPFPVRRVYWIHGMRAGEKRGFHAHRRLSQAVICLAGRVRFELDDGQNRVTHWLDRPDRHLIVTPGQWRDFQALEDGSVLLVLASDPYDEADYIRDYAEFLAFKAAGGAG